MKQVYAVLLLAEVLLAGMSEIGPPPRRTGQEKAYRTAQSQELFVSGALAPWTEWEDPTGIAAEPIARSIDAPTPQFARQAMPGPVKAATPEPAVAAAIAAAVLIFLA